MKKIDAHLHVNLGSMDAESLVTYLDRHQIEKCWLHTWEEVNPPVPSIYQPLSIDEAFTVYRNFPDRIVLFYAPDPGSKIFRENLLHYMKAGLKGCGELKISAQWKDRIIEEYLMFISSHRLPLLFHMEAPKTYYIADRRNPADRAFGLLMNGLFNGVSGYYMRKIARWSYRFAD